MIAPSRDVVVIDDHGTSPSAATAVAVAVDDCPGADRPSLLSPRGVCRRCVRRQLPWYKQPLPLRTQLLGFFVLFVAGVFVLATALLLTNERMPDPRVMSSLPDLLFEVIAKNASLEPVVDMCIGVLNATAVFIALKLYLLERQQRGLAPLELPTSSRLGVVARAVNKTLLRVVDSGRRPFALRGAAILAMIRFVATYLVMVLYRSVVIIMTSFPPTDNACQHPQKIEHPVWNVLLTVFTFGGGSIHCGDLMFSGHTIILTLGFLVAWTYGTYIHAWALRVMSTAVLLFAFYCIIASRSHYTDDVVVAFYSTVVTFIAIPHRKHGAPWQLQMCIRWCAYIRCCYLPDTQLDDPDAGYEYCDDGDDTGGGGGENVADVPSGGAYANENKNGDDNTTVTGCGGGGGDRQRANATTTTTATTNNNNNSSNIDGSDIV